MKKLTPEQTICRDLWAYPVIDLTKPRARTCCKRYIGWVDKPMFEAHGKDIFLNHPKVIQERDLMLQGYQVEGCKACWDLENNGKKSFRLGPMDFQFHFNNDKGNPVDYTKFRPFEQLVTERETLLYSDMPNKLDIGLGTYCDQKCVYCCNDFSTQWESENIKYGHIAHDPSDPVEHTEISVNSQTIPGWYESFLEWFDSVASHLERIALLGGEPTQSPFFKSLSEHIAKRLSEDSHPNASISIVSNMNYKPHILEQLINFKKNLPKHVHFRIEASMESVGEKAEYIRHGVHWNRYQYNVEELVKEGIDIKFITTINALCITSLKEYLEYIKNLETKYNKRFNILPNRLVFPKWLSVDILTSDYKIYVEELLSWLENNYSNDETKKPLIDSLKEIYLDLDTPKDLELIGYFSRWINEIDRRRNTKVLEIFPEFTELHTLGMEHAKQLYTRDDVFKWTYKI